MGNAKVIFWRSFFRSYFWAFLLFLSPSAKAGNIDSIRNILKFEKTDSLTIGRYLYDVVNAVSLDKDSRLEITHWVLKNAKKNKLVYLIGECKIFLGQIYLAADDYENATRYFIEAYEYGKAIKNRDIQIKGLFLQGNVYYVNGQYKKALEVDDECLVLSNQYNNKSYLFEIYNGKGIIGYKLAGNNEVLKAKAVDLIKKSFEYIDPLMLENKIYAYQNLAGLYAFDNKPDSALVYLKKCEPIIKEANYPKDVCAHYYLFLGVALQGNKQYSEALKCYLQGLSYAKDINSLKMQYEYYWELHAYYKEVGNAKTALTYLKQYHHLHDSVVNTENFAKLVNHKNKYENEKRERKLLELHEKNRIHKKIIIQKDHLQFWLYVIVAVIMVVLILLSYVIYSQVKIIKNRKQSFNLLTSKNLEIESKGQKLMAQGSLIGKYQSQMSPRFIFDTVDHLKDSIKARDNGVNVQTLQSFSKLMRQTLAFSERDWISLSTEIEYLNLYVDFEKKCNLKPIQFIIDYPTNDPFDEILIPPMMVQPVVDNCVRQLDQNELYVINVSFEVEGKRLKCIVEAKPSSFSANKLILLSEDLLVSIYSRVDLLLQEAGMNVSKHDFVYISDAGLFSLSFNVPLRFKF